MPDTLCYQHSVSRYDAVNRERTYKIVKMTQFRQEINTCRRKKYYYPYLEATSAAAGFLIGLLIAAAWCEGGL